MDQLLNWRKAHSSQLAGRRAVNGLVFQDETGAMWLPDDSGVYKKQGAVPGSGSVAVAVSGAPGVGNVLTASFPMGVGAVKWQRWDGATWGDIAGATSLTYTQVDADSGRKVRPVATAYSPYGAETEVPGVPVTQLYQMAARLGLPGPSQSATGSGRTGSDSQFQARLIFTAVKGGARFKIRVTNQYAVGAGIGNGLGVMTYRIALWINGTTQVPVTFAGGRDAVLQPGDTVESDWINQTISAGINYAWQYLVSFPVAQTAWAGTACRVNAFNEYQEWGNSLTDRTLTNWNSGTRYVNYAICPPIEMVTDSATASGPAVLLLGDSISSDGANDATSGIYFGYVQRALANSYPWMNDGASGLALTGVLTSQVATRLTRFANRGFTHCICPLTANDIAGGATAAQIIAAFGTLKGYLDDMGIKLIPFTPLPRTNATNDGELVAGNWAIVAAVSANFRANNGVGYGFFDANSVARDSTNNNLWRTDLGTPTSDGIHPQTVIHTALTTGLQAALPSLLGA